MKLLGQCMMVVGVILGLYNLMLLQPIRALADLIVLFSGLGFCLMGKKWNI
jgi:hypothetical protein